MNFYRPRVKQPLDGVFYWIMPGQMWVTDSLHLGFDSEGLDYAFVPWLGFDDPLEDLAFNEGTGSESFFDVVSCDDCGITRRQVQAIDFTMSNDIPQPFVSGVGLAFLHRNARSIIENCGFRGFRFIPNSKRSLLIQDFEYVFVESEAEIFEVPGDSNELNCENCRTTILACNSCGRICTNCPACGRLINAKQVVNYYIDHEEADGQHWPVRLSSWNLDDVVGGAYWFCVTGALLETLICKDITPFAFGPIETECDGASLEQLQRAKEVARDFRSLKQMVSERG